MDDPNTTLTVTLGDLAGKVEERVRSGEYESPSEVVRAGLEALAREERAFEAELKAKVEEALADTRPWLSADEMSNRMRAYHQERLAKARDTV
ncbi:MAG: type II toxin-antitoxin system ParD family antitoxin [Bosea sp. (in: a-proteobacteria)]|uniref:ribbon-helix-helix domain-containing protein n=1 Tax=Bosea sp. (in: a-proteobacteria) TaxID=1871050 RepID=UPI0027334D73|nr:type II toxin-antitoxin system ParD family antitoxin [Bosea sp. (in: a-proteobacteria)]MDP3254587.1 type II toxin-antitoxin system ParD family antitoxin [Bosea sp. (in: a-proteobacteria)]MDP3317791.1 type II toxin-antitoxin system ParD family antitoxin [Bosea sp. (in: a-proteobacteria)]